MISKNKNSVGVATLKFVLFGAALQFASTSPLAAGAVLFTGGQFRLHDKTPVAVTTAYYTDLLGPSLENQFSAPFVTVGESNSANNIKIDYIAKRQAISILEKKELQQNRHGGWAFGEDVLPAGNTLGLGGIRAVVDGTWKIPLVKDMDSLVIDLLDTSKAHPKFQIAFHGWKISTTQKISLVWTLSTTWESHLFASTVEVTQGELTQIVTGLLKGGAGSARTDVGVIKDENNVLLAALGPQTYFADSLLTAIHADKADFAGFKDDATSSGLLLNLGPDHRVTYYFAASWVHDPSPVFRQSNWKQTLFAEIPSALRSGSTQQNEARRHLARPEYQRRLSSPQVNGRFEKNTLSHFVYRLNPQ